MFSDLLQRARQARRSLRIRIAVSAIAAVAVSALVGDTVIYLTTANQIRNQTATNLIRTNALLATEASRSVGDILETLELLTTSPSFRNLNLAEISNLLQQQRVRHPHRRISVWSADGRLIMGEPPSKAGKRNIRIFQSRAFQQALKGQSSLQILPSDHERGGCMFAARGIWASDSEPTATPRTPPQAVLSFCMPFSVTETSFRALNAIDRIDASGSSEQDDDILSLHHQDYSGKEFMMVNRDGTIMFPLSRVNDSISDQSPATVLAGPWGPFVRLALSDLPNSKGLTLSANGRQFFVVKQPTTDNEWVVMNATSQETAFRGMRDILQKLRFLQLITLVVVALVLYRVSSDIASPIRKASAAIRKISSGDFSAQISHQRQDELGDLYNDINATGTLLSSYVSAQTKRAAAEQQLATAQQIQQSFLIRALPASDSFELAANFLPAYEIGADWYDSLRVGRFLYVIIADVCDKGVPSALFMSVFRSLLRSNILTAAQTTHADQPVDLAQAVSQVNEYMAANHGDSCMFATMFVASYDTESGQLRYVNAGHDLPLVLRGTHSEARLEPLPQTGPAVGVFPGAAFLAGESTLAPGDLLFTFTDGLTDARSPEQEGWGTQRLRDFLLQLPPEGRQPHAILQQVLAAIERHQGKADRFDDLTVLTLRIQDPRPAGAPPFGSRPS